MTMARHNVTALGLGPQSAPEVAPALRPRWGQGGGSGKSEAEEKRAAREKPGPGAGQSRCPSKDTRRKFEALSPVSMERLEARSRNSKTEALAMRNQQQRESAAAAAALPAPPAASAALAPPLPRPPAEAAPAELALAVPASPLCLGCGSCNCTLPDTSPATSLCQFIGHSSESLASPAPDILATHDHLREPQSSQGHPLTADAVKHY
eukprot:4771486-Pyramimonas_sp.AAC.1